MGNSTTWVLSFPGHPDLEEPEHVHGDDLQLFTISVQTFWVRASLAHGQEHVLEPFLVVPPPLGLQD